MQVSGVSDYSTLFQNYKLPTLSNSPLDAENKVVISDELHLPQNISSDNSVAGSGIDISNSVADHAAENTKARSQKVPLEDISLTFNRQEEFGYLGKDSDIRSLDVEQAISSMKKDQVLQQYQYFVGRSQNLIHEDTDGLVFAKF